jgi:hypothetical protein
VRSRCLSPVGVYARAPGQLGLVGFARVAQRQIDRFGLIAVSGHLQTRYSLSSAAYSCVTMSPIAAAMQAALLTAQPTPAEPAPAEPSPAEPARLAKGPAEFWLCECAVRGNVFTEILREFSRKQGFSA